MGRSKNVKSPKVLLIVGGVFLVAGVSIGFSAARQLADAKASSEWPTVSGKVISSEVRTQRSSRSRGTRKASRSRTTHHAKICYEYTVDGQRYTADRVLFGGSVNSDSSDARQVVARYPEGKQVAVHYDPAQPDQAVLEPGVHSGLYIQLAAGGLFALVGTGVCFAGVKLSRPKPISCE